MAYDAVLFDMDGVLLRGRHTDRSVYREAVATALADFGVEAEADLPGQLVSPDSIDAIRETCRSLGVPPGPVWACRERTATSLENERLATGDRQPFSDASALDDLATEYTLGVVSNNRHGTVRFAAGHFGWDVDVVRGRFPTLAEFETLKPDPAMMQWALDRIDTGDVLYVGDRRTDVEAAHRVGIDAALLTRNGEGLADSGDPRYTVDSLDALAQALSA